MLKTALWVTAVYATAAVARAASDWSCSLNGKLDATGRCQYHLYVSEMANNCTLETWSSASETTHAVSDVPEGPYTFQSTAFNTFHHNPQLRLMADGTVLMFMIGGESPPPEDCKAGRNPKHLEGRIIVSSAAAIEGPWSKPIGPLLAPGAESDWDYIVTNPSPVILRNGTSLSELLRL